MKNTYFPFVFIAWIIISCNSEKFASSLQIVKNEGYAQGSTYHISYLNEDGKNYQFQIDSILQTIDQSLSTYSNTSIISKVNQNKDVELDTYFIDVFNRSVEIAELTDGAFDPTVSSLVNYWGFGFKNLDSLQKNNTKISNLLKRVGYKKVTIKNGKIEKTDPLVEIDFNAIAQGYSVDVLANFLESKSIENYMVEVGGELIAKGKNDKAEDWKIGIDKPIENNDERDLQAVISLKNQAVATSGNYRKFYEENGVKYSHTINPKTGYPAKNTLLSVTIVASNCMDADGFATAFMVMGLDKTKQFLKNHPELQAYLISSSKEGKFETYVTEKLKAQIEENPN